MKHLTEIAKISDEKYHPAEVAKQAAPSRRRFLTYLSAGASSLALQACGGTAAFNVVLASSTVTSPAPTPVTPVPVIPVPVTPVTPTQPTTPTTPTVPTPATLSLSTIPDLNFVEGLPSSVSLAQWIAGADPAVVTLTLNAVALPAGVTYNSNTKSFDYDGVGAATAGAGYIITALVA